MKARDFFIGKYGEPTDFTSRFALSVLEEFESNSKDAPIELLYLSTLAYNCLKGNNIRYVSELKRLSNKELLKIRNLGETSLANIRESLAQWEKENE